MANPAEELGYPAWAYPFAALVVGVMGLVVIYAAVSFINLDIDAGQWGSLDRAVAVVLAFYWGRYVVKQAEELGEQE